MAKGSAKKVTTVHEHPLHVPVSEKNPEGLTTRHTHLRRLKGESLSAEDVKLIFQNYDRGGLRYPTPGKLKKFPNADKYDEVIAVWTGIRASIALRKSMSLLRTNLSVPLCLILAACATSQYRILAVDDQSAELRVTPDRVLLECEWLYDADEPGLYGFMIHVLDEEKTVTTLSQGNTLDKESCGERLTRIGEILKKGKRIYLAGRGRLNKPRRPGPSYTFPQLGTYPGNKRSLDFAVIANEFGMCFDAYRGNESPCPREPFPTKGVWP